MEFKIGSHVGMKAPEMFLGSAKEAFSYGANTFMVYTGAPQNTKRKDISELNIPAGLSFMKEHGISDIVVHAPYIINLGNSIKPQTYEIGVEVLKKEIERTKALGSKYLVLHPGSHVGAGEEAGIKQVIKGLNEVIEKNNDVYITLETMSGKGSELCYTFEMLAQIYDGVVHNEWLRVCFDSCHMHDSGYDVINDFDSVVNQFDKIIGIDQAAVVHLNDSKNTYGAKKDRHENIGFGYIGFDALCYIAHHEALTHSIKILESPYVKNEDTKESYPPYRHEIEMLRNKIFDPMLKEHIIASNLATEKGV